MLVNKMNEFDEASMELDNTTIFIALLKLTLNRRPFMSIII